MLLAYIVYMQSFERQNKYYLTINNKCQFNYNKLFGIMQQYTNQAINYAGHYVNVVKQWWWPPAPVPLTPLEQLKFYLQHSNIQFKTKHSQQNIVIQRICMMYNELITGDNRKYQNFKSTIEKPVEYIPVLKINNKIIQSEQAEEKEQEKSVVSIVGQLKIKTDKIKCNLIVSFVLHQDIENKLPIIYIRNPDTYKVQPNPQYIQTQKVYESILGGVGLSKQKIVKLNQEWKNYKSQNLLNLVKSLEKILTQSFPFAKRFTKYQSPDLNSSQFATIKKLNSTLHEHLEKTQSLVVLKQSIGSQKQYLAKENQKMKQILEESNKQDSDESKILKLFKIQQNQYLLDLFCMQKAYLDCIKLLQNQVQNPGNNKQSYEQQIQILRDLSISLFEVRCKIVDITQKLQNGKQSFINQ